MRPPDYDDFDLELSPGSEGTYVARVLASPRGEASAVVTIPIQGDALENVILKLGRTRSGVRSLGSPQARLARTFGAQLFDAVFAGEVGTTFRRSVDDADDNDRGLRIRLRLSEVPELADIPWEYLYSTGLGRFLVLSGHTPLVRYLDLSRRVPPLRVSPPLRILLVVSAPVDLPGLDHADEVARMHDVLGDLIAAGSVIIEAVPRATLAALRLALRRGEYHILHFIGHGGFDPSAGDGVLSFEDEHQRSHRVYGGDLGTLLHDHRTLRLAVLNACEGARQSPTDPFSGVAQSLVRQGLPAVVAMQFEISDVAALVFGQELYAAIADGYPVDAALAQARLAVFSNDNDVEWGTPVLYLRARDGRIFDIPENTPSRGPSSALPFGDEAIPRPGRGSANPAPTGTDLLMGSGSTASGPPAVPTGLDFDTNYKLRTSHRPGDTSIVRDISLTWEQPSPAGSAPVTGWHVWRDGAFLASTGLPSWRDTDVPPADHTYRVAALGDGGIRSDESEECLVPYGPLTPEKRVCGEGSQTASAGPNRPG